VSSAANGAPTAGERFTVEVGTADWLAFVEALVPAGFVLQARAGDPSGQRFVCVRSAEAVTAATAAGVAHEVSNPMTAVLANLELALHMLDPNGDQTPSMTVLRAELEDAHAAANHVSQLLRAVKAVGRATDSGPTDVGAIIDVALRMAGNEIRSRARLTRISGETPAVAGTALRLGQVFLNLLLNAAQAIPPGRPEAHEIRVVTGTNDQGWAVIAISDTGVGIPPAQLGRVAAPFFTTKGQGTGSGLGLSISHGIVASLGGRIELTSKEGAGTTATVYLPPAPRR
jgi:signal transduction histidine kinase